MTAMRASDAAQRNAVLERRTRALPRRYAYRPLAIAALGSIPTGSGWLGMEDTDERDSRAGLPPTARPGSTAVA
jgi:hypothetical protein